MAEMIHEYDSIELPHLKPGMQITTKMSRVAMSWTEGTIDSITHDGRVVYIKFGEHVDYQRNPLDYAAITTTARVGGLSNVYHLDQETVFGFINADEYVIEWSDNDVPNYVPKPDPMDDEHEDGSESTMADDLMAMFGTPDPDSDTGMVCGLGSCAAVATRVALDTDSETKIPVCEIDSRNSRWWGTWPIEEDSQFAEAVSMPESDAVPVGSNKPAPDWTRRVESPIVWAERMVRNGTRHPDYLPALVNEVGRLIRRRATGDGITLAKV